MRTSPEERRLLDALIDQTALAIARCQLVQHAGKVVTHQQLLQQAWGPAHVEDVQYLRVLMRQLRKKLEPDSQSPHLLTTEQGVGHRLFQL